MSIHSVRNQATSDVHARMWQATQALADGHKHHNDGGPIEPMGATGEAEQATPPRTQSAHDAPSHASPAPAPERGPERGHSEPVPRLVDDSSQRDQPDTRAAAVADQRARLDSAHLDSARLDSARQASVETTTEQAGDQQQPIDNPEPHKDRVDRDDPSM